jgi:hypothetical protein
MQDRLNKLVVAPITTTTNSKIKMKNKEEQSETATENENENDVENLNLNLNTNGFGYYSFYGSMPLSTGHPQQHQHQQINNFETSCRVYAYDNIDFIKECNSNNIKEEIIYESNENEDDTSNGGDGGGGGGFTSILVEDGFIRMSSPVEEIEALTSQEMIKGLIKCKQQSKTIKTQCNNNDDAELVYYNQHQKQNLQLFPNVGTSPVSDVVLLSNSSSSDEENDEQPVELIVADKKEDLKNNKIKFQTQIKEEEEEEEGEGGDDTTTLDEDDNGEYENEGESDDDYDYEETEDDDDDDDDDDVDDEETEPTDSNGYDTSNSEISNESKLSQLPYAQLKQKSKQLQKGSKEEKEETQQITIPQLKQPINNHHSSPQYQHLKLESLQFDVNNNKGIGLLSRQPPQSIMKNNCINKKKNNQNVNSSCSSSSPNNSSSSSSSSPASATTTTTAPIGSKTIGALDAIPKQSQPQSQPPLPILMEQTTITQQITSSSNLLVKTSDDLTDNNNNTNSAASNHVVPTTKPKVRFNLDINYEKEREWSRVNKIIGDANKSQIEWTHEVEV